MPREFLVGGNAPCSARLTPLVRRSGSIEGFWLPIALLICASGLLCLLAIAATTGATPSTIPATIEPSSGEEGAGPATETAGSLEAPAPTSADLATSPPTRAEAVGGSSTETEGTLEAPAPLSEDPKPVSALGCEGAAERAAETAGSLEAPAPTPAVPPSPLPTGSASAIEGILVRLRRRWRSCRSRLNSRSLRLASSQFLCL